MLKLRSPSSRHKREWLCYWNGYKHCSLLLSVSQLFRNASIAFELNIFVILNLVEREKRTVYMTIFWYVLLTIFICFDHSWLLQLLFGKYQADEQAWIDTIKSVGMGKTVKISTMDWLGQSQYTDQTVYWSSLSSAISEVTLLKWYFMPNP